MLVEMGRVMYHDCLGISLSSVHGYEHLAQEYGVYNVPYSVEMSLDIFTVSLSPVKTTLLPPPPFTLHLSSSLTNYCPLHPAWVAVSALFGLIPGKVGC